MTDDAANLVRISLLMRSAADAADAISRFISTSWTRGDRLLCADCHDLRGAESTHRCGVGRCDGCGEKGNLWEWERDDLPPTASEFVELNEWAERQKS